MHRYVHVCELKTVSYSIVAGMKVSKQMWDSFNTLLGKGRYQRVTQLSKKKILTRVMITYMGGNNNHSLGSVSLVRLSYKVIVQTQTNEPSGFSSFSEARGG